MSNSVIVEAIINRCDYNDRKCTELAKHMIWCNNEFYALSCDKHLHGLKMQAELKD
ncbi:hypothetical protein LCGC14_1585710 [marine sediment metagenome]|uniref:Uncharacterized protein n=1 Tax=marine sediment metagenome TaxID=412755 RepID=A0A0F9KW38_9ZZZZ